MTDTERNAKIESIKNRVLDELLGPATNLDATSIDDVEVRKIDKNWNTGKCWMDQPRFTSPMNNSMESIADFNRMMVNNKGVVVTVMRDKPAFTADPIK